MISMMIQKAENGYVVTVGGKTFVFVSMYQAVDFIYSVYEPSIKGAPNDTVIG
jgi:hypothetical protein